MSIENTIQPVEVADHDACLRNYLSGHDELCPMCEYNLRGLTGTKCPECGEVLLLRVSLREPKLAAYLCGLIGLSVGVGCSGLLMALAVLVALFEDYRDLIDWSFAVAAFQFAFEGLAIWLWLARRNWIRRRSKGQRWALAMSAWGCTIGLTVLFFATAYYSG